MPVRGTFSFKKKYELAYRIYGEGEETILCFHGFGQDATVFQHFPEKLKNHRVISFDLPYHGSSGFPLEQLSKAQWKEMASALFEHLQVDNFKLAAYSLGGRFVIRLAIDFPERIDQAIFIAADGFHYTMVYSFASSVIGRRLFKYVLKNPKKLFSIIDVLLKYGLVSKSIVKFVHLQLAQKVQRIKVYNSWIYLKSLKTSQKDFVRSLEKSQLPVDIYVGSKDYVIPESYFDYVTNRYRNVSKTVLPNRHHEMIDAYVNHEH